MATKKKPTTKKFNLVKVLKDFEDGTFTLEETAEKIAGHYTKSRERAIHNLRTGHTRLMASLFPTSTANILSRL
jgi:hypothetical protein